MPRAVTSGTRLDFAFLAACVLLSFLVRLSADSVRDNIASALRETVLAPLFMLQATTDRWRMAITSFDAVVASRDSAVVESIALRDAAVESERLRSLLVLGSRLRWGYLPAQVLHEPRLGRVTTITIAAGEAEGVTVLSPVISTSGLVGMVQSVDRHTSIVGIWSDPDFAVGAMTEDGQAYGIIGPHLDADASGFYLELKNVQFRYNLAPGTNIVAAGAPGGVYPAMVPIGTVVRELEGESGWVRNYLVRPAIRPQELSSVIVLTPERAQEGVQGIWDTATKLDSLLRVINSAGDSIARRRHEAELQARADSTLRELRGSAEPPGGSRVPPDTLLTSVERDPW